MNSVASPQPTVQVGRWVIAAAITGTILIGLGAFWLSFTALADLAHRSGIDTSLAWIWPLIVDGVIVVATISVVALSRHGRGATGYAWLLLAGGAAVSVSANVTHAAVTASAEVPGALAAMVASIPPIVLLAITHLTVLLTRYRNAPTRVLTMGATSEATVRLVATSAQDAQTPKPLDAHAPTARRARRPHRSADGDAARRRAEELRAAGRSNRSIAAELGVHPATVGRWLGRDHDPSATEASDVNPAEQEEDDGTSQ